MVRTVICDIDGTLADLSHRLHYIKNGNHDWDSFFAAAKDDTVIEPVRGVLHAIAADGYKTILVSGRTDKIKAITEEWLFKNCIHYDELFMRSEGDYRQDTVVKSQILDGIIADGHDILCVLDDRPSVVAMWRERGLTCLQVSDWEENKPSGKTGLLSLMVGPSCAGKSYWLSRATANERYGIEQQHIVSSDRIRADLCDANAHDQSKNEAVFAALHAVVKARITHGLPAVVDATNLRRKDRLAITKMAGDGPVRYFVIDRSMGQKVLSASFRSSFPFGVLDRHQQTFNSQIKDIMAGDHLPNVTVIDLRSAA